MDVRSATARLNAMVSDLRLAVKGRFICLGQRMMAKQVRLFWRVQWAIPNSVQLDPKFVEMMRDLKSVMLSDRDILDEFRSLIQAPYQQKPIKMKINIHKNNP